MARQTRHGDNIACKGHHKARAGGQARGTDIDIKVSGRVAALRIVAEGILRLGDAHRAAAKALVLHGFQLLHRLGGKGRPACAVHPARHSVDLVRQIHILRIGKEGHAAMHAVGLAHNQLRQLLRARAALAPALAQGAGSVLLSQPVLQRVDFSLGIAGKAVDRHHSGRSPYCADVIQMALEIGAAIQHGRHVFLIEAVLLHAAVVLERADGSHQHHAVRVDARRAALDIDKLFRAQIGAEARLGHGIIAQLHGQACGDHAVAAMGDVGEGAAVHQAGRTLDGLHKVGRHRVAQQRSHGSLRADIATGDQLARIGAPHRDARHARLHIHQIACHAEGGHDLAGGGDIKAILTRHTIHLAAQAGHNAAQLTIVHIHAAAENHLPGIDAQGVALLNVVIHHGGQQIVGRSDGMQIAGKMQVDVLHGQHLGVAAARRAALDAKYGALRGLAQRQHGVFAVAAHAVRQRNADGGFALARRGWRNGRDQNQPRARGLILIGSWIHLGDIAPIAGQAILADACLPGDLCNGLHHGSLRNLKVCEH